MADILMVPLGRVALVQLGFSENDDNDNLVSNKQIDTHTHRDVTMEVRSVASAQHAAMLKIGEASHR
jgi:hypothetical protein